MRTLLLLLAATAMTATPALAQHAGHHMPMPAKKKPVPKKAVPKKAAPKKAAAKKAAPKKAAAKKAAPKKAVVKKKAAAKPKAAVDPHAGHVKPEPAPAPDPHAGHSMPEPAPAADPHAGHTMPAPAADPHAGHDMGSAAADPHAGHSMTATAVDPPVLPPPPAAFSGPEHAADALFGAADMGRSRWTLAREHGGMTATKLLVDRAETRIRNGRDGYLLEGEAWAGSDIDKLWLKTEVEGDWGRRAEHGEVQALWSHAIDPWFDVQAGVRYDWRPRGRARLAVGVQGLAPYWIEVDAAAFLSTKGDLTARFEAEHDVRITQTLILQPSAEVELAAQTIEDEGIGAGLSTAELGARLRYQVTPLFAPYVGIAAERAFGKTRSLRRAEGEKAGGINLVAGVRFWF